MHRHSARQHVVRKVFFFLWNRYLPKTTTTTRRQSSVQEHLPRAKVTVTHWQRSNRPPWRTFCCWRLRRLAVSQAYKHKSPLRKTVFANFQKPKFGLCTTTICSIKAVDSFLFILKHLFLSRNLLFERTTQQEEPNLGRRCKAKELDSWFSGPVWTLPQSHDTTRMKPRGS